MWLSSLVAVGVSLFGTRLHTTQRIAFNRLRERHASQTPTRWPWAAGFRPTPSVPMHSSLPSTFSKLRAGLHYCVREKSVPCSLMDANMFVRKFCCSIACAISVHTPLHLSCPVLFVAFRRVSHGRRWSARGGTPGEARATSPWCCGPDGWTPRTCKTRCTLYWYCWKYAATAACVRRTIYYWARGNAAVAQTNNLSVVFPLMLAPSLPGKVPTCHGCFWRGQTSRRVSG